MGDAVSTLRDLRPGQQRIMRLFSGGNHDVVFIPHDVFDLRICSALRERGMLSPIEHEEGHGYELTAAGRSALESIGGDHG